MRMIGIIIILASFVAAVLGIIHSHAAEEGERAIWGLSRPGFTLVVVAVIGMVAGVVKEIGDLQSGAEARKWQERTTERLKEMHADIRGTRERVTDPDIADQLDRLTDRLSAIASQSRESDFSMSDFTYSNFRMGNFTGASFHGALFKDADLRGADLSMAWIDDKTKLPTHQ